MESRILSICLVTALLVTSGCQAAFQPRIGTHSFPDNHSNRRILMALNSTPVVASDAIVGEVIEEPVAAADEMGGQVVSPPGALHKHKWWWITGLAVAVALILTVTAISIAAGDGGGGNGGPGMPPIDMPDDIPGDTERPPEM